MFQTYEEALNYVEVKKGIGIVYDLDRMKKLMVQLRHPERRVKTIHVAGTNGKGSTVTYLQQILQQSSFFVGTFMTPAFGDPKNQIAINGEPMSEEEFVAGINNIYESVEEVEKETNQPFSFFEVMTTLALYYFSTQKPVDMAIIETGMGGKHDATNVITPLVSIITNVSNDHEQFLGDTIEEIAKQKAGIIKSGLPVMTAATDTALEVIKKEGAEKKATVYSVQERVEVNASVKNGKQMLSYQAPYRAMTDVELGMFGEYQAFNAALAMMTVDYLKQFYAVMVDDEQIINGLKNATIKGRFEYLSNEPVIIVDTAHNPAAIDAAIHALNQENPDATIDVLFGAMKDKNTEYMLNQLASIANELNVTTFESDRAKELEVYESFVGNHKKVNKINDLDAFLNEWRISHDKDRLLFITGSHYFVGQILESYE
ncbi:bifunctional folylpolyglutamate synthase/dihydrofolate synthase [Bacillus shivajii]|uniref:bifunctional folylpolyglutamate synthase/dihydrofolate synthase n=1 Tax=Bacillus shivajii TaxID=1983719 RepID=UPI001CFBB9E7|nr:folylpolyglutamate synthase/dihydrofolate synthase family protein [Bacillus shivajii]UCZ52104.1 bifunctional folylpolyglutamate synthase/dihydrofolate synthase [Bacillus shivajii]